MTRQIAIDLFNGVWRLLEQPSRTIEDDERMLHMAHASRYHWGEVGEPVNRSRGEWQCSRVYAVLERPEPALYHARRGLQICQQHGIGDYDLAFAFESLARAHAVAGDAEQAQDWAAQAVTAAADIAEDDDRQLLLSDVATIPGGLVGAAPGRLVGAAPGRLVGAASPPSVSRDSRGGIRNWPRCPRCPRAES